MKKIPKKQFDEVLRLSREYWESGEVSLIKERIAIAQDIYKKAGIDWLAITDLIDCIIRSSGFVPGASDDFIYLLLRVIGWEVTELVEVNTTD